LTDIYQNEIHMTAFNVDHQYQISLTFNQRFWRWNVYMHSQT